MMRAFVLMFVLTKVGCPMMFALIVMVVLTVLAAIEEAQRCGRDSD
jgi:hypothetical protein